MVEEVAGVEEVDFITSHPKNTSKELFEFMAKSDKIKKHIHLPFQSGSNRILEMMNRGYTRESFLSLVDEYKSIVKGTISTDVILGFPSESDQEFEQTREVLEQVRFTSAYIFKYSPRQHSKFEKMLDDVPKAVKEKRHKILLDLKGTDFQIKVWEALLKIPKGKLLSYGDIAQMIGKPKAFRAVGSAIGKNPIAYIIPCHRVIRETGEIGQYRWGRLKKSALIAFESAQLEAEQFLITKD